MSGFFFMGARLQRIAFWKIAVFVAFALFGVIPNASMAQTDPIVTPVPAQKLLTPEGVNLADGSFEVKTPGFSIGEGEFPSKLEYRARIGNVKSYPVDNDLMSYIFIAPSEGGGWLGFESYYISFRGKNYEFPHEGDTTFPATRDGDTLTFTPTGGTVTYTTGVNGSYLYYYVTLGIFTFRTRDGFEVKIDNSRYYYCNQWKAWCAQSVQAPNGDFATYDYDIAGPPEQTVASLRAIKNSKGYGISFNYDAVAKEFRSATATSDCTNTAVMKCNSGQLPSETYTYTTVNRSYPQNGGWSPGSAPYPEKVISSLTSASGATTTFQYDSHGFLLSQRRSATPSQNDFELTHAPEPPYIGLSVLVSALKNGAGQTNNYTYYGSTFSPSLFWANGQPDYDYKYESVTRITKPMGIIEDYQLFAPKQVLTAYRDPLQRVTNYGYQGGTMNLSSIVLPSGLNTLVTYDGRSNVLSLTARAPAAAGLADIVTTAAYPACTTANYRMCNKPSYVIDPKGNRTDYQYDALHGGVTVMLAPANATGTRSVLRNSYSTYYPAAGVVLPPNIPNGSASSYEMTAQDKCLSSTVTGTTIDFTFVCPVADRIQTSIAYEASTAGAPSQHLLASKTDNAGGVNLTTSFTYDLIGNTLSADGPLSGTADTYSYRYNAERQKVGEIFPDPDDGGPQLALAIRTTYDTSGRPTLTASGTLNAWQDETVAPSNWTGFTTTQSSDTTYDVENKKLTETLRGSNGVAVSLVQHSYDAASRSECIAQRMNPAVYGSLPTSACSLGTQGTYGPDRITKNMYDVAGQILQNRKAVGTDIEQAYATYSYTANGRQEYVVDANGNRTKLEYDGFDRQVKWIFPSAARPSSFDPATPVSALTSAGALNTADYEQYGYDDNGNRTSFRKRDGSMLGYTYDALNRVTVKTVPERAGLAATHTRDVYQGYDLQGHQLYARFDSASGEGITNTYDAFGQLTSAAQVLDGTTRTLSYQYDLNGNRTRVTFPDGNYATYSYDGLDRPSLIQRSGISTIASYTYDAAGRRTGFTGGITTTYGYDPIGRLSSLSNNPANTTYNNAWTFGYNPASQIAQLTRSNALFAWTAAVNVNRAYTTNGLNQYTAAGAASFGYDANANLTSDGSSTFTYDIENRLVSASGAKAASLRYDPLGRLYEVGGTAGTTRFLYDGDALVGEYDTSSNLLRRYVHGADIAADDPIAWYEGSTFTGTSERFLRSDWQGSVVLVTDSAGTNVLGVNTYDEFGIPGTNTGRFQYTGQAWLPELGMYHYKARIYSPTLGRFLQTDPIGYKDQINLYAYVANDPVDRSDPTGEESWGQWWDGQVADFKAAQAADARLMNAALHGDKAAQHTLNERTMNVVMSVEGGGLAKEAKAATTAIKAYESGSAAELKSASRVGDGLDIHHAPQASVAEQAAPGYSRAQGPAIALPRAEHQAIPVVRGATDMSVRSSLAQGARDLRNYTNASNQQIQSWLKTAKDYFGF